MQNYIVTVNLYPLDDLKGNPVVEKVQFARKPGDRTCAEDLISGFEGSPIEQLMKKHNFGKDENFVVVKIEKAEEIITTLKAETKFVGRIKRFDEIYGYWITDKGELIPVTEMCGHHKHVYDGYQKGWIAVVTHNETDLSFRFYEHKVTKEALNALSEIVRKSNYPTYLCDFGIRNPVDNSKEIGPKPEVQKQIKNLQDTLYIYHQEDISKAG